MHWIFWALLLALMGFCTVRCGDDKKNDTRTETYTETEIVEIETPVVVTETQIETIEVEKTVIVEEPTIVEIEKIIIEEKIEYVQYELVYEGYYCNRVVISHGDDYYVFYSYPVKLTTTWFAIGSCQIRINKEGVIEWK